MQQKFVKFLTLTALIPGIFFISGCTSYSYYLSDVSIQKVEPISMRAPIPVRFSNGEIGKDALLASGLFIEDINSSNSLSLDYSFKEVNTNPLLVLSIFTVGILPLIDSNTWVFNAHYQSEKGEKRFRYELTKEAYISWLAPIYGRSESEAYRELEAIVSTNLINDLHRSGEF